MRKISPVFVLKNNVKINNKLAKTYKGSKCTVAAHSYSFFILTYHYLFWFHVPNTGVVKFSNNDEEWQIPAAHFPALLNLGPLRSCY